MSFPNPRIVPAGVGPGLSLVGDPYYFDDFVAGSLVSKWDTVDNGANWLTSDLSGTSVHTISDDEPGGVWRCDNGATTDNHGVTCQMPGSAWQVLTDRDIVYEIRLKSVNSVTAIDWIVGLCDITTTIPAGTNLTDAIVFRSGAVGASPLNAGNADIICSVGTSLAGSWTTSTMSEVDSGVNLVADTFVTLAFHVIGNQRVKMYVDGNEKLNITSNIPSSVALTPTVAIQNNGSVRGILEIDYIFVSQVR